MSVTAIVTNHNYARYLDDCLGGATRFCDEVLVYDDGSTDDSLDVIAKYGVKVLHREDASGDPVWGSNQGIIDTKTTHLVFLDADNMLVRTPPLHDCDYTFAPILIAKDNGAIIDEWRYDSWPLDSKECFGHFLRNHTIPVPWGGVWRTEFVKDLRWLKWKSTAFAADFRTCVEWIQHSPTLRYSPEPFLVFRVHDGQWSASPERQVMQDDVADYIRGLR